MDSVVVVMMWSEEDTFFATILEMLLLLLLFNVMGAPVHTHSFCTQNWFCLDLT